MTGPEHYREAERLMDKSLQEIERATPSTVRRVLEVSDNAARAAQVHATLALAAATVECASDLSPREEFAGNGNYITQGANAKEWQGALS